MAATDTTKTLIQRAQTGDMRAFEEIVTTHEKGIFSYLYGYVRQRQDAEDLTQEVFVRLYRHIRICDPDRGFKSWLYTMATNIMYDWFRKVKNRKELFLIDDEHANFETIDESSSYSWTDTAHAGLAAALESLRPAYRTSLVLYYYEELSYDEIANILQVPLNTVKTYLYRAKSALKEILMARYGDDASELFQRAQTGKRERNAV